MVRIHHDPPSLSSPMRDLRKQPPTDCLDDVLIALRDAAYVALTRHATTGCVACCNRTRKARAHHQVLSNACAVDVRCRVGEVLRDVDCNSVLVACCDSDTRRGESLRYLLGSAHCRKSADFQHLARLVVFRRLMRHSVRRAVYRATSSMMLVSGLNALNAIDRDASAKSYVQSSARCRGRIAQMFHVMRPCAVFSGA